MSTNPSVRIPSSALDRAPVWLNSAPITADELHGRVVLVDFWTYSCVNWLRTLPYLTAWDARYRDRGLVVVGAHAPEFAFERDLGNARRAARDLGVAYPVVIDNDFTVWRSFANHYWPALYLVDRDGQLSFHDFGEGAYVEPSEPSSSCWVSLRRQRTSTPAGSLRLPTETRCGLRRPTWVTSEVSGGVTLPQTALLSTTGH